MKINRSGQGALISEKDYHKICLAYTSEKYKLIFQIGMFTGERWRAICELKLLDVFDKQGKPKPEIYYSASTRKANPRGKRKPRTVRVCPRLKAILEDYQLEHNEAGWLFPSRIKKGCPIQLRCADKYLRRALANADLSHKGISSHSTRRTFITNLSQSGASVPELKKITGHESTKALLGYIEVDVNKTNRLIDELSFSAVG